MNDILSGKNRGLFQVVPLFFYRAASKLLAIFFATIVFLFFQNEALAAAPAYRASGTFTAGTGAITVPYPASMAANDVCLLAVESENQAISLTTANGFVQVPTWSPQFAGTAATNPASRLALFWKRTVGGDAAPVVTDSGDHTTGQIHCFSGVTTSGNPWDTGAGGNDGAVNDTTGTIPGSTTTVIETLVVLITSTSFNGNSTTQCSAWTNADLTSLTERADNTSTSGLGGGHCMATGVKATAGLYATTTVTLANTTFKGAISLALKPDVTTLATGADPAAATIAPGAAATDVDLFTLQTGSGTEAITSVTVNLSTNSGVGRLAITDNAGTELGFTTTPATGSNTITVAGMSATTVLTTFKVRITPLSHAAMPLPAGGAYAITAPVTAWAGPNAHAGSDTNPNALTIDNLSPSGATAVSGSAGNAQVTLNWTTSASADFSRSVMLRWTGGVAGAEVPAEGTDYANGNAIGTATVICVRTGDAASTAVSGVDGAGTGGCSATALIGGQAYTYKIFQKDSNGNYDTGVAAGTFTPTGMGGNVINTYYPGTASVTAGATSITLGPATGATTPIAIGDLLLIMQMQDATIDSTNTATYGTVSGTPTAGKYEYALAASAVPLGGGTLSLLPCGTINAYTDANYVAGSSGQKRYQVIRVPVYTSATLNSTLTAQAWNGSTGGVLAFDVTGALALNSATVTVDGTGFRGGASRMLAGGAGVNTDYVTLAAVNNNASKGEGIAGTPQYVFTAPSTLTNTAVEGYPNGSHARGAPADGGGGGTDRNPVANDQNPGGGGGANGGAGGLGGIGWCPTFNAAAPPLYGCGPNSGGLGGSPVAGLGASRLTLGGGGGGGTSNNGTGALASGLSSSGSAGGGIIMLRAGSMSGAATFNANGSNGDSTVCNDGGGGGGAGGVVLISAGSGMGGATINVNGGKGGDTLAPPCAVSAPHGPGGGGGGGYAITTGAPAASSAAAGANGVTYNGGVLFGAYGATAGSAGSSNSGLTAAAIPGVALGATSCTAPLDHLEIQSSGSGLTCAASTLTIKACTDAAVPCATPYTSGVSGTLTATGVPTVNWDGTTGGAAGAGFVIPNGSSSVTKDVQVATAGSVVFGITSPSPVPASATVCNFGAPACTFTASLAGFIFSSTTTGNSYTIPAQISGIATPTLYLRAVQAATTNPAVCTPAIISQTIAVNMGYVCNNPAACQAGNLATITNTITSTATAIAPGGTAVSLNFDANGSAPITARYDDVGQITLNANKTVTPFGGATAVTLTGSSNPFVVAPHHFGFSSITPGLIKAGNNFSATVTAYNGLATPTATPNFGKESVAEGVTLTPNLGAGNNPAISNNVIPGSEFGAGGMVNDANGVATVNNLSWGEVGLITITANLTSGSYLGSGLTASGTSGNVGRFIPDHFDTVTSGGMPCPAGLTCPIQFNGFVYSGQPFTTSVYARNLAGGTTLNYDSTLGYSRAVTLSAWDAAGGATANPGGGALTVNTIPSASFSLGAAATSTPTYTFATVPTAPTNIFVRADESAGGDGVTSLRGASSVEGGMKIVSGRIKISNAHGSELLQLPVGVTVQYWNGTSYVTSTTDSLTTFGNANVVFSNWQKLTPASGWVAGSTSVVAPPASVAFTNGVGSFRLSKPGSGNTGSVDITTSAPAYLPSNTGRATFGVYKGSNNFIYLRENY